MHFLETKVGLTLTIIKTYFTVTFSHISVFLYITSNMAAIERHHCYRKPGK